MQSPPDMKVRLSVELRRQVEAAAKVNNRTLNAEIVSRLEATFRGEPSTADCGDALGKRLKKIEERLDTLKECLDERDMGPLPQYWD